MYTYTVIILNTTGIIGYACVVQGEQEMPNQRDVAVLAGVSSASVSRYLQSPELVSGRTGARIKEAIGELNYRIDAAAQSLKTGKTYHIGILTPGIGPYYWILFQIIQALLSERDYYTTILHTRAPETWLQETHRKILPYIRSNRVEGFICLPTETDEDLEIIREIRRHHEKVVLIDAGPKILGENPDLPHFGVDNYLAGRKAAELLWAKGHRKLLHVCGDLSFASAAGRLNGFADRIKELGGSFDETRVIRGGFSAGRVHGRTERSQAPGFYGCFLGKRFDGSRLLARLRTEEPFLSGRLRTYRFRQQCRVYSFHESRDHEFRTAAQ